jgi:hypothetical protein
MITLIIFIILTIIVGILVINNSGKDEYIFNGILLIIICACAYGIVIFVGRIVINENHHKIEYKSLLIKSLTLDGKSSINGEFILGCGSIYGEEHDYYITYGCFESNLLRIKMDAYKIYLNLTDNETPQIKKYYKRNANLGYKSLWFWNKKPCNTYWEVNHYDRILIVPKNTLKVVDNYIIDK